MPCRWLSLMPPCAASPFPPAFGLGAAVGVDCAGPGTTMQHWLQLNSDRHQQELPYFLRLSRRCILIFQMQFLMFSKAIFSNCIFHTAFETVASFHSQEDDGTEGQILQSITFSTTVASEKGGSHRRCRHAPCPIVASRLNREGLPKPVGAGALVACVPTGDDPPPFPPLPLLVGVIHLSAMPSGVTHPPAMQSGNLAFIKVFTISLEFALQIYC